MLPSRVAAYVLRRLRARMELLVLEHEGVPEADTQLPAGGIRPVESRRKATMREVKDATGPDAVRVVTEFGVIESPHPGTGQLRRTSYWALEAGDDLRTKWRHPVTPGGPEADDSGQGDGLVSGHGQQVLVSLCRWERLPLEVALVDEQGSMLSQLPLLLGPATDRGRS